MEAYILTVLCPSRGRPQAAYELRKSFEATKTTDARLVFLLDRDDPTIALYPEPQRIGQPTGDPTGPLNTVALASDAEIIGFTGDDSRFETKGWDREVTQALSGRGGFCWGFDGTGDTPRPSTCFATRNVIQTLGWFALPTLRRGWFDIVWRDLALGANALNPVTAMFRHDNSAGDPKSPNFKPEAQVDPKVIEADRLAYEAWRSGQAVRDIRKLGLALDRDYFF